MAESRLLEVLRSLRRRLIMIEGTSALFKAVLAAIGVLLTGLWCDVLLDFSPAMRFGVWGAAAVSLAAITMLYVLSLRRRAETQKLAAELDRAAGTAGQIRSGIDLAFTTSSKQHSHHPDLTAGLKNIAVNKAASLAGAVAPARIVPARSLWRSLGMLAGGVACVALLAVLMPRLARAEWLRFTDPLGDHPPFSRLNIDVQPGDVEVIYGQGFEITASTDDTPAQQVELVFRAVNDVNRNQIASADELESLPMFPGADGAWRAAIANVTSDLEYYVRCGKTRSPKHNVRVITVPKIEAVTVVVTPPAYTRDPIYEGAVPDAGLTGLSGTHVRFFVTSNRPLSQGTLSFSGQVAAVRELTPEAGDPTVVSGDFTLTEAGRFEVRVVDVEGQESTEPYFATATLLQDHRPLVRLLDPKTNSFATPDAVIPVRIAAEDDYGITQLQLFRSLNQSRYLPLDLQVPLPPERRHRSMNTLPLAAYGLQPGDEIRLFARVVDNDPMSELAGDAAASDTEDRVPGKGTESSIVTIQIISKSDLRRMERTRDGMNTLLNRYQQARRRMEAVAEQMRQLQEQLKNEPADSPLNDAAREKMNELAKQLQNEADALRKLSEEPLPYELDQQLSPKLDEMAKQLQEARQQLEKMAATPSLSGQQSTEELQKMLEQFQQQRDQFQKDAGDMLDLLSKIFPLKQSEARFMQLAARQTELAERLKSLTGRDNEDDPALKIRMRELEEEQTALQKELENLQRDMEQQIAGLPDDERLDDLRNSAADFLTALYESGADRAMQDARDGLSAFSGTKGQEGAQRAADILNSMIGKCNGMGKACENCSPKFSPSMGQCMNQTMQQLLADAGLNPGSGMNGMGQGSGNGMSARRSTMQNVGLYGNMPTMMSADSRSGGSQDAANATGGAATGLDMPGDDLPGLYDAGSGFRATGSGTASIPLQYRRRVSRYFMGIADELENE